MIKDEYKAWVEANRPALWEKEQWLLDTLSVLEIKDKYLRENGNNLYNIIKGQQDKLNEKQQKLNEKLAVTTFNTAFDKAKPAGCGASGAPAYGAPRKPGEVRAGDRVRRIRFPNPNNGGIRVGMVGTVHLVCGVSAQVHWDGHEKDAHMSREGNDWNRLEVIAPASASTLTPDPNIQKLEARVTELARMLDSERNAHQSTSKRAAQLANELDHAAKRVAELEDQFDRIVDITEE